MTDLERRLGEVLREHAEDAMSRTDTRARLQALEHSLEEGRSRRRPGLVAATLAVAAGVAVAALLIATAKDGPRADETPAVDPGDGNAQIAKLFVDRLGARDFEGMTSYLADGASLDLVSPTRDRDEMLDQVLWSGAAGLQITSRTCAPDAGVDSAVTCVFEHQGLGSQRLGLGPYGGNTMSFELVDGKITSAVMTLEYNASGFRREMWDPLAAWVRTHHPDRAARMYADWPGITTPAVNERSTQLWATTVEAYVQAVGPECLCPL